MVQDTTGRAGAQRIIVKLTSIEMETIHFHLTPNTSSASGKDPGKSGTETTRVDGGNATAGQKCRVSAASAADTKVTVGYRPATKWPGPPVWAPCGTADALEVCAE